MNGDIILDNLDLSIANGDLVTGDALLQRQQLIVGTGKNDWKQNPDIGVDPERYLDDESDTALFSEIREQFRMDGMTAKLVQARNGELYINAE